MKKLFPITVVGAILVPLVAGLPLAAEPGQADRPDVQRITLAQIRVGRDVDENLKRIRAAFAQAKKDKAKWIMFPEGALSGYGSKFDQAKVAAALTEIMALCKDARVIAVLGTCWQENGQITNEIVIIDADGKVVARYVKRCLTYGEAKHFKVGATPLVHQVNGLKVGTLICNDLWVTPGFTDGPNPHLTLQQARLGAQVIFHAVNSGSNAKFREYHESNLKVRSAEAKCPIVVVNAAADEPINCASGVVMDFEYVKTLPTKGEVVETVTFQPVKPPPPFVPWTLGEKKAKKQQEDWAVKLKLPVEVTNKIGMKLILVPPAGAALPKPYYLGKYEVTQREWEKVMGYNPSQFGPKHVKVARMDTSMFPVERVSWFDCVEYCNKLSEREGLKRYYELTVTKRGGEDGKQIDAADVKILGGSGYHIPTGVEWEHGCRAGTMTKYHFGDKDEDLLEYAWFRDNSDGHPHAVGKKKPNAFGLYDMHGNVREWNEEMLTNATTGAPERVTRGGNSTNPAATSAVSHRTRYGPASRTNQSYGLRLARFPA